MALDQRPRRGAHDGQDLARHELAVPRVEHGARMARQRLQLEIEKLVDVERARLVLLVELLVARFVHLAVEHALLDQELRPFEVAVAGEQRVVEIEEGETPAQPASPGAVSPIAGVPARSRASSSARAAP